MKAELDPYLDLTRDAHIERYIALTQRKRELEADLRRTKEDLQPVESWLANDFMSRGVQSIKQNGYTVYLKRDLSVKSKGGDTAAVVDKLRRARLGELIGINWPRIRAWVKERCYRADLDEWDTDITKLPPSLREVVEISEFTKVCCRKA